VIVSGKPKTGNDPEIKGLFLGVKSIEQEEKGLPDELFLWIYNNSTVFILNLKYYTISSVEACIGGPVKKTQTMNFKDSDQCSAVAKLHIIQNALGKQNRARTDGLIEVATYKGLPEYLTKMAPKADKAENSGNPTIAAPNGNIRTPYNRNKRIYNPKSKRWENEKGEPYTGYGDAYGDNYSSGNYHSKEVATSVFKRTSRYSAKDAITSMKAKIEEIRAGKYKPIKLKKIPADDIEEEEKGETSKKTANNMTEEEDAYAGMYGGFG